MPAGCTLNTTRESKMEIPVNRLWRAYRAQAYGAGFDVSPALSGSGTGG